MGARLPEPRFAGDLQGDSLPLLTSEDAGDGGRAGHDAADAAVRMHREVLSTRRPLEVHVSG